MFCSFVRSVAVIGLAVSCGASEAGLVIFDSTGGLDATKREPASDQNLASLAQGVGIVFTTQQGTNITLQSATFGLYSPANSVEAEYAINLELRQSNCTCATPLQIFSDGGPFTVGPGGTAATFDLTQVGGWLLNAGTQYSIAVRRVNSQDNLTVAGTSIKRTDGAGYTQNGLTFDGFVRQNTLFTTDTQNRFWIQLNGVDSPAVVPEPATIGLLIGGLGIGLGQRIRRRRRKVSVDGGADKPVTAFRNPLHRLKAAFSR